MSLCSLFSIWFKTQMQTIKKTKKHVIHSLKRDSTRPQNQALCTLMKFIWYCQHVEN